MRKIGLVLFSFIISIIVSVIIAISTDYRIHAIIIFACVFPFLCSFFYRYFEFFICLLIFINLETFYMFPFVYYKPLLVPIVITYFLYVLSQNKFRFGSYGGWVLMYFLIFIMGLIVATWWGQPITLGIKDSIVYMLLIVYFVIVNSKIDIDKLTKYLVICGVFFALLGTIQYLLGDRFYIIHIDKDRIVKMMEDGRGLRIHEGSLFISSVTVVAFAKYLNKRGIAYLYIFGGLFLYVIFCVKTRMLIAAIPMTSLLLYMIHRKFSLKAIFTFVAIIVIFRFSIIPVLSQMEIPLVRETRIDLSGRLGTSASARHTAYTYYFNQFKKSPLIGYGYWNFNWDKNTEEYLQERGIHLSDIGITHLIIESGLVGLLWLFYGLVRSIFRILRGGCPLEAAAYIILGIITIVTLDFFMRTETIFIFGIFLGILGSERNKNLTHTSIVEV